MPQAASYDEANKPEFRERAKSEFNARHEMIKRNRRQYDGHHTLPLKARRGNNDNVILNWNKQHVDAMLAFLMPYMPTIELDENDTTDDEKLISSTWDANGDASLLYTLALYGSLCGQIYAVLTEDDPVRIVPIDPDLIVSWVDESDNGRVLWYEQQWGMIEGDDSRVWRKDTVPIRNAQDEIIRWEELIYRREGGEWKDTGDGYVWDYPLSPIVAASHMPRPGDYYGASELTPDLIALNDSGNYVASLINRILRFHSFPRPYLFGATLSEDAKRTEPGGMIDGLPIEARIDTIELQSDLASSRAHLIDLRNTYFRQARVIMPPGEIEAFKGVTILGIKATYMPMIMKNEILRRQYSQLIKGITRRILMLNGRDYDVNPVIEWGNALPIDEVAELQIIQAQVALGMSKQTAFERLGLDYERERERVLMEAIQDNVLVSGFPVGVSG